MAEQPQIRLNFVITGLASMLKIVENVHLSRHCFRRNDLVLLRHVAGPVDFATMINLKLDLNPFIFWRACRPRTTQLRSLG